MSTVRTQDGRAARGAEPGQDPAAVRPGEVAGAAAAGRHRGAGLALGLLSAMTFGTSGTLASSLIDAGWSPAAAVIARATVAAVALIIPALVLLRGRWHLLRRWSGRTIAYGVIGVAACQLGYFNAVERMPVGVALLLEYMGVVFVVLWLWARHGQRPRPLTIVGGVSALGGLALMLNLSGAGGISLVGVAWALLAAVSMAVYFSLSASADAEPLPPVVMTWGGMIVGALALVASGATGVVRLAASTQDVTLFGHQVSWLVSVLGLSLIAAAVAYVAGIGAARRLGAKLGSFVAMAEILFAVLFAWVLLGQTPTGMQFLGGALILCGVVMVRLDEP